MGGRRLTEMSTDRGLEKANIEVPGPNVGEIKNVQIS